MIMYTITWPNPKFGKNLARRDLILKLFVIFELNQTEMRRGLLSN